MVRIRPLKLSVPIRQMTLQKPLVQPFELTVHSMTRSEKQDPLDKIVEKAEGSGDFTEEEIETLKKVAEVWKGLEIFGKIAGLVKTILVYLGWMVGLYLSFKFVLADWVKGVAEK